MLREQTDKPVRHSDVPLFPDAFPVVEVVLRFFKRTGHEKDKAKLTAHFVDSKGPSTDYRMGRVLISRRGKCIASGD